MGPLQVVKLQSQKKLQSWWQATACATLGLMARSAIYQSMHSKYEYSFVGGGVRDDGKNE
jgi:hypothetical protein